jgi:hypothetical protein
MSCAFARLAIWTMRRWFASDRSSRHRAPLELVWIEQDLALAWSWFETYLSIIEGERTRGLAIESPEGFGAMPLTSDEAAMLAALIFAPWSSTAARACLTSFLSPESAAAAVSVASRVRRAGVTARRSRFDAELLDVAQRADR